MRYLAVLLLSISQLAHAYTPDEDGLYAVVDTTMGEFTIQLEYKAVPLTVGNFIGLAEGAIPRFDKETKEVISTGPYYDGLEFHWVKKWESIRTGDPEPDDTSVNDPGYTIPDEIHPTLTHDTDYTVSMLPFRCLGCWHSKWDKELRIRNFLEDDNNGAGSLFFINLPPRPNQAVPRGETFNGVLPIFGIIVDGREVVDAIGQVPVNIFDNSPIESIRIKTITIVREGAEAEAFYITQLELPFLLEPEVSFGKSDPNFEFTALPSAPYSIRSSSDLENWTEVEAFINDQNAPIKHSVPPADSGATFIEVESSVAPFNYQEKIPGARLSFNLPGIEIGSNWTLNFDQEGTGTITIENYNFGEPMTIDAYQYHRLFNGARLRFTSNNYHEILLFIKFETETTGSVFAWIHDYRSLVPPMETPNAEDPIRYTSTGTFEMIRGN